MTNRKYKNKIVMIGTLLMILFLNISFANESDLEYVDLNDWNSVGDGTWTVETGGRQVSQSINGQTTFFLSDVDVINKMVSGTIQVNTTADDDFIGFVFGYQELGTDQYDFLVFDWKELTQTLQQNNRPEDFPADVTLPRTSYAGYTLGYMNGKFNNDMYSGGMATYSKYLWFHEEDGEKYHVLDTKYSEADGWTDSKEYQFKLLYTDTQIKIIIDDIEIFDVQGSFKSGKFGFYNYSQKGVIYGNVQMANGTPVKSSPIAMLDIYNTNENEVLTIDKYNGIMLNDYDPNLDKYKVVLDSNVSHGTLLQNVVDGSFEYTPDSGFAGVDAYSYHLVEYNDSNMLSETVSVTLNITANNVAPRDIVKLSDDEFSYTVPNDTVLATLVVEDDDMDDIHELSLVLERQWFDLDGNKIILYDSSGIKANTSYPIKIKATDIEGASVEKELYITFKAYSPQVDEVNLVLNEDEVKTGFMNGTDADSDSLTYQIITNTTKGLVELVDAHTGEFNYTPNKNASGIDQFTYKANDGTSDSLLGDVTLNITPTNDKPVTLDGILTVTTNTTAISTLEAMDVDGDKLTYSIVTQGSKGTAVMTNPSTGAYNYTVNPGEIGEDHFTFKVNDTQLNSEEGEITVAILPTDVADLLSLEIDLKTLSPEFDTNTMKYDLELENTIDTIEIKCGLADENSTVSIDGSLLLIGADDLHSHKVDVGYGANSFDIEVTAQDGVTKKIYELKVTRKLSNDADLSALEINDASITPSFNPVNMIYNSEVSYASSMITIQIEAASPNATIMVQNIQSAGAKSETFVETFTQLLELGINEIIIEVTAQDGVTVQVYKLLVKRANLEPSAGGSVNNEPEKPVVEEKKDEGAIVIVDNVPLSAGIIENIVIDEKKQTTVIVDEAKLEAKLKDFTEKNKEENEINESLLVNIPIMTEADIAIGMLNGQIVKNMENKKAVLQVETEESKYILPAEQINIEEISKALGKAVELKDIEVKVSISKPTEKVKKLVAQLLENSSFKVVAPIVDFEVTCSYKGHSITIKDFEKYVKRLVKISEHVNPNKITTGVVVNTDGSLRHVPTKISNIDGVYYAEINSLTNSSYSVIWHTVSYDDIEDHWAKEDIKDMASRMVNLDDENKNFSPDSEISRAEFAAIVVRGLGIKANEQHNKFSDVDNTMKYYAEIETAYEYGLMVGKGHNIFGYNDSITREEAMAVIAKAMNITGLSSTVDENQNETLFNSFLDSEQSSDWSKQSIKLCVGSNIIVGIGGSQLALKEMVTKAEAMTMISNLLLYSDLI